MKAVTSKINNIDDYIAGFSDDVQKQLNQVRETIKKVVPEAEETIKYGMPTFVLNGNLVHFAGYKNHIGFYPTPLPIKVFEKELSMYETSKGAVQFPIGQPLPLALITKMVKFRVKDATEKAAVKKDIKASLKTNN